jgi:hypothetical protein
VIILRLQWFGTKAALGLSSLPAFGIVLFGIALNSLVGGAVRGLLG